MGVRNPNRRRNPPKLFINVYQTNQDFGGPEEGGWWYETGRPLASRRAKKQDIEKKFFVEKWFEKHAKKELGIRVRNARQLAYLWQAWGNWTPSFIIKNRDAVTKQARIKFAEYHDFRHDISSVICTGSVEVYLEKNKPQGFPKERPRYE